MLDIYLKKYQIEDDKYYKLDKLYEAIIDLGLWRGNRSSFTRDWFIRKRKNGTLILPDKPNKVAFWQLTGKQIKEIILAFAPGGKGHYDYKESE